MLALLSFLTSLYDKGIGYSQINTARSAMSALFSLSGPRLGDHPLVSRFTQGVKNLRHPVPKYSVLWPVNVLLSFRTACEVSSLKDISVKLATLLAVLSIQKVHTWSLNIVSSSSLPRGFLFQCFMTQPFGVCRNVYIFYALIF